MNKNQYYVVDIYDPKQVESSLNFAPYLGYELFSIQDVYSRSDISVSADVNGKTPLIGQGEFNGDFATLVNSPKYVPGNNDARIKTVITAYSKVVFKRDEASFKAHRHLATQESVWKKLGSLLQAIAKKADEADKEASKLNAKKTPIGLFVFGLIVLLLGLGVFAAGFALRASKTWAIYLFYGGIGIAGLGFLLLIIGLIVMGSLSSKKRNIHGIIQKCIVDYRTVSTLKEGFEKQLMANKLPRIDSVWFYNICEDYNIPYVAPNSPKKN